LLKFFWLKGEGSKKKSRQAIHTLRRFSDKGRANVFDNIRVDQVRAPSVLGLFRRQLDHIVLTLRFPQSWTASGAQNRQAWGTAGGFAV
jgi:hypothetical protein